MNKIDINTAHNISISLDIASLTDRIGAAILDFIIILTYGSLIAATGMPETLMTLLVIPAIFFYHLICEVFFNGQSLGKRVLKLRVMATDGKQVRITSSFIRWAFRLVDIAIGLGSIGVLTMFGSKRNQRIGDIMAGTVVIKYDITSYYTLEKLDNLSNIKHNITYPNLSMYNDKDMLYIKDLLNRYQRHNNDATRTILNNTASKIKKDLNIKTKVNPVQFLQTVLEDYIIQTRNQY